MIIMYVDYLKKNFNKSFSSNRLQEKLKNHLYPFNNDIFQLCIS